MLSQIELFEILSEHLGPEKAKALVHFVDARAEKRIEESTRLFSTKEDIAKLRAEVSEDIAKLRAEVSEDITKLRAEVSEDITKLRAEMSEKIVALRAELKTDMAHLKVDIIRWLVATAIALGGLIIASAKFM